LQKVVLLHLRLKNYQFINFPWSRFLNSLIYKYFYGVVVSSHLFLMFLGPSPLMDEFCCQKFL